MNKLNKKGITMIELIVSVALVSVVMVFLYRLLANVKYDRDDEFFASKNQEQRIEIINYIQNQLRFSDDTTYIKAIVVSDDNKSIFFTISDDETPSDSMLKQYQIFIKDDKTLEIKKSDSSTVLLRSWTIEQGTLGTPTCKNNIVIPIQGLYTPVECTIPIYTANNNNVATNNNTLDDITITVLKRKGESE